VLPAAGTTLDESTALIGLRPGTTYHFQIVATIGGQTYDGGDETFKTLPVPVPPANTIAPSITGTSKAGSTLECSPGTWSNSPQSYGYQWELDGTPIQGATRSTYVVASTEEGTTLTCIVTATGPGGKGTPATSNGIAIAVPHVPHCPAATGSLSGTTLGLIKLGMTKAQAQRAYTHSSTRGFPYKDFFCLTPDGVRVGFASPKLRAELPRGERAKLTGRVV
jgi:hypothetical protein